MHRLTRRELLEILTSATGLYMIGCGDGPSASPDAPAPPIDTPVPACTVTPAQTEGPFFVDENLNRSDITPGASAGGAPLELTINVLGVTGATCTPLAGAQVDIWHCDTQGLYSDVAPGPVQATDTRGMTWLRGFQIADAAGSVKFKTIYPGWYTSRTIHIHMKVRSGGNAFTSQIYFDETVNDVVMNTAPYNNRGQRTVRNVNDGIYSALTEVKPVASSSGYTASFTVGMRIS